MPSANNPDLPSLLKLVRKPAALPNPAARVVRVGDGDQFARAVRDAQPGDSIMLADGRYLIPPGMVLTQDRVTIRSESADRERVIIDSAMRRDHMLTLKGCDDTTIADVTFANNELYGVRILGDSAVRRTRIHNVKFHNIYTRGVKGTGAARKDDSGEAVPYAPSEIERVRPTDGSIRHCLFINDEIKGDAGYHEPDYVSGIDMMHLKNWTIADNVFTGIRGKNGGGRGAIFIWIASENVISERNLIINCDRGISYGNPSSAMENMYHGIIRNNFIVGGANMAIEVNHSVATQVCNNSIFATNFDYARTVNFARGFAGGRCFNNLVHGKVDLPAELEQGQNMVGDLSGFFADPARGDLHLTAKAAEAVGRGAVLSSVADDFDGRARKSPPNIGADDGRA
jgi:hypothetical protein